MKSPFTITRESVGQAALILVVCGVLVGLLIFAERQSQPPDFTDYPAGDARKSAFVEYLGPLIDAENVRWLADRQHLKDMQNRLWTKRERLWVEDLSALFDVPADLPDADRIRHLLHHVDAVPRGLALAQAAKESAWGTSRFAREGNAFFGQRCYEEGCGMVPARRVSHASFEVRSFDSVEASVASYVLNINAHREYAGLRDHRAEQRLAGERVSSIRAAERMAQYSERRREYVDEIQSLIHFNRLDQTP